MSDEQRPVEVVYDFSTHTRVDTPLTDAQWTEHKQREQEVEQEASARLEQERADAALLLQKADEDPAFAALARKLGVQL